MTLPSVTTAASRLTRAFLRGVRTESAAAQSVTLHDFFHEFTHEMLHVDGRILQIDPAPDRVAGISDAWSTFQGRRARWISPIRLYLIFSVAFFGAQRADRIPVWRLQTADDQSGLNISIRKMPQAGAPAGDSEDAEAKAKELGFESIADLREAVNHAVLVWVPRVMFVLLPLFAWLVALAYRPRRPQLSAPPDICGARPCRMVRGGGDRESRLSCCLVPSATLCASSSLVFADGVHGSGVSPRVRSDTPVRSRESRL